MRPAGVGSAPRRASGAGFTLPQDESPAPASAGAAHTIGGIDSLLALQGVEDAPERRKRGVRTGRRAIEALEELKVGLLSGGAPPAALGRLKSLTADLRHATGDPGLDDVLAEIALRAEVELAKAGMI